jgi:hypothetical protein
MASGPGSTSVQKKQAGSESLLKMGPCFFTANPFSAHLYTDGSKITRYQAALGSRYTTSYKYLSKK